MATIRLPTIMPNKYIQINENWTIRVNPTHNRNQLLIQSYDRCDIIVRIKNPQFNELRRRNEYIYQFVSNNRYIWLDRDCGKETLVYLMDIFDMEINGHLIDFGEFKTN